MDTLAKLRSYFGGAEDWSGRCRAGRSHVAALFSTGIIESTGVNWSQVEPTGVDPSKMESRNDTIGPADAGSKTPIRRHGTWRPWAALRAATAATL